jgi:hypothetical protein
MNAYFKKELASNSFFLPDGNPVQFELVSGDTGIAVLDTDKDAGLIAALKDAATKRRGGIVVIDQAEYDDLKKNLLSDQSGRRPREILRVFQAQQAKSATARPASEKNNPPQPVSEVKSVDTTAAASGDILRVLSTLSNAPRIPPQPFKPATAPVKGGKKSAGKKSGQGEPAAMVVTET